MKKNSPIKLKLKYSHIFEKGMNEGATAKSLDVNESAGLVSIRMGFMKKREIEAFKEGYELGALYVNEWARSEPLLRLAVSAGDIVAVDFKSSYCPSSGRYFFEEV